MVHRSFFSLSARYLLEDNYMNERIGIRHESDGIFKDGKIKNEEDI